MTMKFLAPDGNDRVDPDPAEIEAAILKADQEFWEQGSGDAAVRFENEDAEGEMIVMVRDPFGVFVQFTDRGTGREVVLSNGESEDDTISIHQGGEPWELPRTFFVPRSVAAEVVGQFARTGKRPRNQRWVDF